MRRLRSLSTDIDLTAGTGPLDTVRADKTARVRQAPLAVFYCCVASLRETPTGTR